ncbi:hypothetical protein MMC06_002489 [Schaereria dolodes]|nr:hypothetical protein [Schaereria dolodes]
MRRTLQTTQIGLQWLIQRGVPVQLRGEWQENSDKPCDTGTKCEIISKEFPSFNFNTVFPEYPMKTGKWAFTLSAVTQRGLDCRHWLKSRPEKVIAVVSHSGFLRVGVSHTNYSNADYRVFEFADDGSDNLIEWMMTEERGGGMGTCEKGRAYGDPSDFPAEIKTEDAIEMRASQEVVAELPN